MEPNRPASARFAFGRPWVLAAACVVTIVTGALTLLAWRQDGQALTGVDDANIFFVYARHLVEGHGFVYNIGGEHVEGFTSFLWVLICATAFTTPAPETALLLILVVLTSVATAVSTQVLTARVLPASQNSLREIGTLTLSFLLIATPSYVVWNTLTLMDSGLWTALLVMAVVRVIADDDRARDGHDLLLSGLLVLVILARPEWMVWVPVLLLSLLAIRITRFGLAAATASLGMPIAACVVTAAALTAFRLYYFGFPLPNSYYAKVSPSLSYNLEHGARYLRDFVRSGADAWLVAVAALAGAVYSSVELVRNRGWKTSMSVLPLLALTGLTVPVLTGGDYFKLFRPYQSVWPILVLNLVFVITRLVPEALERLWTRGGPSAGSRLAPIALALSLVVLGFSRTAAWRDWQSNGIGGDVHDASEGRKLGDYLNVLFSDLPDPPSLGMSAAGGIKVTYRGNVIDLLGLNSTRIAHNGGTRQGMAGHAAFETASLLEDPPEIVLPALRAREDWWSDMPTSPFEGDPYKGAFFDARFQELYDFRGVRPAGQGREIIAGYFRKDFLDKVSRQPSAWAVERPK